MFGAKAVTKIKNIDKQKLGKGLVGFSKLAGSFGAMLSESDITTSDDNSEAVDENTVTEPIQENAPASIENQTRGSWQSNKEEEATKKKTNMMYIIGGVLVVVILFMFMRKKR